MQRLRRLYEEKENARDRSVPDGSDKNNRWYLIKIMIMEVLVQVLERLPPRSLLAAVLVCPLWLHLAEQASCQVDIVNIQTD